METTIWTKSIWGRENSEQHQGGKALPYECGVPEDMVPLELLRSRRHGVVSVQSHHVVKNACFASHEPKFMFHVFRRGDTPFTEGYPHLVGAQDTQAHPHLSASLGRQSQEAAAFYF